MLLVTQPSYFMRQHLLRMVMIVVLYVLLALLALRFFAIASGNVSLVWPSSGLALAALLMGGRRYAWAVLLGAFATNILQGSPPVHRPARRHRCYLVGTDGPATSVKQHVL